jgi:hypothetical protein
MTISKQVSKKICRLAEEGKTCSKIQREDFPNLTWWDVRGVLEEAGTSSSLGIIKTISGKLNRIFRSRPPDEFTSELLSVKKLATQLYERSKEDYKKLSKIRKALEG